MSFRVQLIVSGPDLAAQDLEGLSARAKNAKPIMRTLLGQFLVAEAKQFETSGARSGRPWAADKPYTIARKESDDQDLRPERMTRALELSLVAWSDPNGIRRLNNQSLVLGSRLTYAKYQYRRPLLRFTQGDVDNAQSRIARWLMDGVA